ncbi:MAG: hypothetical protein AAGJ87_08725, partial [Pseudomonadota bacterium]
MTCREKRRSWRLAILGPIAALSGCSASSFLSGSASMRIDVDVYKGPLANTVTVQKSQLDAILKSTVPALTDIDNQLVASMCRIGCVQRNTPKEAFDPKNLTFSGENGETLDPSLHNYVEHVLYPLTPGV